MLTNNLSSLPNGVAAKAIRSRVEFPGSFGDPPEDERALAIGEACNTARKSTFEATLSSRQRQLLEPLIVALHHFAEFPGIRIVFDLPDVLDEQDRLWGVWRFKEGLGARFAPHIGAHDYPAFRLLYWAYAVALPAYLRWLGRRA